MSMLSSWLAAAPPDAAVEIAPEGVAVAVLGSRGRDPVIQAYGTAPLPAGAVQPSLTARPMAAVIQAPNTAFFAGSSMATV